MISRTALLGIVASLSAFTASAAEEPPAPDTAAPAAPSSASEEGSAPTGRVLNGHVFMPSAVVPGALTTTSFGTYLLLAYGETTGSLTVGDRTFSGTFDYAGVGASLRYEYAFLNHFSARISIDEMVFSGINGKSAIAIGTAVGGAGAVGVTASLPVGDKLKLAFLFDAGVAPGAVLTIGNGIRTIVDTCNAGDCTVDTGEVFGLNHAITFQPALAASWAPWRSLGVTANFAYGYVSQKRNTGTFTGQLLSLAAAVDYDFHATSKVPLGLQAQFAWTAPVQGGHELQHVTDLGGGVFYTGREHLALGLQVVARQFAVTPDVNVSWKTFLVTTGLRYYW